MKYIRILFWPFIMLKNILDPNWWANHIGEKSGAYDKARKSKIRTWANNLEGWKYWAWQIGVGGLILFLFELLLNQLGMTMLPWR